MFHHQVIIAAKDCREMQTLPQQLSYNNTTLSDKELISKDDGWGRYLTEDKDDSAVRWLLLQYWDGKTSALFSAVASTCFIKT